MFLMTSLLRKRLFIGYFITGFIVISMVTAMINERCRLKELKESDNSNLMKYLCRIPIKFICILLSWQL